MNIYLKHLISIILGILIYVIYIIVRKEKDKLKIIKNFILVLTCVSYFSILLSYYRRFIYDISAIKAIFLALSIIILLFSYALIKNNHTLYKKNIKYYIIICLIVLISITFFIGRASIYFKLSNLEYFRFSNLTPFRSIKAYLLPNVSLSLKIKNIGGNILILIPLSFFLMLKNDKFQKERYQILVNGLIVLLIEVFQVLTVTGTFDIDDIILNLGGVIIFTFLITRFKLIDKIKKLFYKDFLKNIYLKYILFILASLYPLYFVLNSLIITLEHIN